MTIGNSGRVVASVASRFCRSAGVCVLGVARYSNELICSLDRIRGAWLSFEVESIDMGGCSVRGWMILSSSID